MSNPELIVVGTGRSATKSMARLLRGAHEPNMKPTTYLAMARSHGWMSVEAVATVMSEWRYPKVIADYKQSELIDATSRLWPEVRYLWVTRNPADTVASMVAKGWYLPSDDMYPPGYLSFWYERPDTVEEMTATNDMGNRTRGDYTGDFTVTDWAEMSQVERCGWWWNYCNRVIAKQLERVGEDRYMAVRLEDIGPWFTDPLGAEMPTENGSGAEPVSGWEPFVSEMAGKLGYEIQGGIADGR